MSASDESFGHRIAQARLARADDLGVFPPAAARILRVVDDPRTNLVDLEKAVSMDPVLTAQVLKVANSAYFGLARTVGSLRQALFVLGFRTVRNMSLSLAALTMGAAESPWSRRVWRRSIRCCRAMRVLGEHVEWDDFADPFAVGLLHRIGTLLLLALEEKPYVELLEQHPWASQALLEAEVHRFAFDHVALGAACLERWNLPEDVCLAVRFQDHPEALSGHPEAQDLTWMLWLAVQLELRTARAEDLPTIAASLAASHAAQAVGLSEPVLLKAALAVNQEDGDIFG
ncbi:MAG: HDOD domain-containing protein [Pseudomonadota bacterium]